MPRRGKGQQATRVATGQQYGQAKAQEEAQNTTPLPRMQQPRPGAMPLARRSQRPNESIMTGASPAAAAPVNKDARIQQRQRALRMLMYMEPIADRPGAGHEIRNTVRRLKRFVGDMTELVNEVDPRLMVRDAKFLEEET